MARLFDDGSSEYLTFGSPVVSTPPFAMFIRYNCNDNTLEQTLMSIADTAADANNDFYLLELDDAAKVRAISKTSTSRVAETSINWTANVWQNACAIFAADTDRRVFLNGGNKGTNAVDDAGPAGLDATDIGALTINASRILHFSGSLAEAAIWDLSNWPGATASDKADAFERILPSLNKDVSPESYPLGLVSYWDLVRGLNDRVGGFNMTVGAGTAVAAHPRIIRPSGIWVPTGEAAAPPEGAAGIMTTNTGYWGPTF